MLKAAPRGIGRRRRVGTWRGAAAGGGGGAAAEARRSAAGWAGLYPGLRRNNFAHQVALDGGIGDQQLSAAVLVNISIVDVNNKPPVFVEPGTISVKENTQVGTIIYRAEAHDLDDQPVLRYSIDRDSSIARDEDGVLVPPTDYDYVSLFDLNNVDGSLRVARIIDRERIEMVKLVLTVQDMAALDSGPPQKASATLTIMIEDENDNNPKFRKPFYKSSITENSKNGVNIATVVADDADKNRTMTYFLEGPENLTSLVHLDSKTGEIVVANRIDHEACAYMNLTVTAVDSGQPARRAAVDLFIQVLDENDNNPYFPPSPSSYIIPENAAPGTVVATIAANDADSADYSKITYLLDRVSTQVGRGTECLLRWVEWWRPSRQTTPTAPTTARSPIYWTECLLRWVEGPSVYSDGLSGGDHRGKRRRQRRLQQDHLSTGPSVYSGGLRDRVSTQVGRVVATIVANVADSADYSKITYLLDRVSTQVGRGTECLLRWVEWWRWRPSRQTTPTAPTTARSPIYWAECLLRWIEGPSVYSGGLSGGEHCGKRRRQRRLQQDHLSTGPSVYSGGLRDRVSTQVGGVVATIAASHADSADYSKITYLLDRVSTQGKFLINADTGTVTVSDYLDRETQATYNLVIEAWDNYQFGYLSGESRNAFKQIVVHVEDVNDNAPILQLPPDCTTVTEFHKHREPITSVRATDADDTATPNGRVQFHLVGGKGHDLFRFEQVGGDANTGRLFAKQPLKDRFGNYTLIVEARDLGTPANVARGELRVCVTDYNDHAPVFLYPPQNVTVKVPENATIGTTILEVHAIDGDIGSNGAVRYRLRQDAGGGWRAFSVQATSGALRTTVPLDRDKQTVYQLRIEAYDLGIPTPLSSDLDLTIYVQNVDNYRPRFPERNLQLNFTENGQPAENSVYLPSVIERDPIDRGDEPILPVCYYIVEGNEDGVFELLRDSHRYVLI
ncbi:unnamed protein product [Plutella xylostella]|uniref:(diamondback moth) hypothetical protein n=1 Tax=Plutella xylostella TaxID=51655 RepID=A0A8S4EXC8_PLUXY|nr:unnamed protein product [Plutella xylostella]